MNNKKPRAMPGIRGYNLTMNKDTIERERNEEINWSIWNTLLTLEEPPRSDTDKTGSEQKRIFFL